MIAPERADEELLSWRCFQCGMVLTTEHEARNHFGDTACVSLQHERERHRLAAELAEARAKLLSNDVVIANLQSAHVAALQDCADANVNLAHAKKDAEAARADLASEREKRCGTCAYARETNDSVSKRKCVSDASECYGWVWGIDHGCPHWQRKDGAQ